MLRRRSRRRGPLRPGGANVTEVTGADLQKNVSVSAPGVTDKQIDVAVITAKTNILGGHYGEYADGIQEYFDYVNAPMSEGGLGGIYGRQAEHQGEPRRPLLRQREDGQGEPGPGQGVRDLHRDAAVPRRARHCRSPSISRRSSGTSTRRWPGTTTSSERSARSATGASARGSPAWRRRPASRRSACSRTATPRRRSNAGSSTSGASRSIRSRRSCTSTTASPSSRPTSRRRCRT